MDKVYHRETLPVGRKPKKKKDEHARKRNNIINFRVSPIEKEKIDARIKMSGLPRGLYFIESSLYQEIKVTGNVKTFDEIEKQLLKIESIVSGGISEEHLTAADVESLKTIVQILNSFKCNRRSADDTE